MMGDFSLPAIMKWQHFQLSEKLGGGLAELLPWTSRGQTPPVQEPGWQSPLGGNPEGQRSPGRLDTLQERDLKGIGAGPVC